jgi:glycosyltransferase involved in cell wall biosynthesis
VKVLYFGTYDRASPRNTQVVSCLRRAGITVVERHRQVWGRHNWSLGPGQVARMLRAEGALARHRESDDGADVVLVGYPGHFDLPAARRVARGRPVVFNPLVSLHDTFVGDRRRFRRRSAAGGLLRVFDNRAFRAADLVVADTEAHADFFRRAFALPAERVVVAFVGADEPLFRPGWHPPEPFHVLFVGKLIPLHGLETILAAAALAPEIAFRVAGEGQLVGLLDGRPANVEHIPWIPYEDLPEAYRAAGCALGIFGSTDELLTDGVDALLVPPADPAALASALRRIAGEEDLAARLAAAGHATYEARASEEVLGARWRTILEDAVGRR